MNQATPIVGSDFDDTSQRVGTIPSVYTAPLPLFGSPQNFPCTLVKSSVRCIICSINIHPYNSVVASQTWKRSLHTSSWLSFPIVAQYTIQQSFPASLSPCIPILSLLCSTVCNRSEAVDRRVCHWRHTLL